METRRGALTRARASRVVRRNGNGNGAARMNGNGMPASGYDGCGGGCNDPYARQRDFVNFEQRRPPTYGMGAAQRSFNRQGGLYCPENAPLDAPPGAGMGAANPMLAVKITPELGSMPGAFQNTLGFVAQNVTDAAAGTAYALQTVNVPQTVLGDVIGKEIRQLYVRLSLTGTGVPGAEPEFSNLVADLLVFRIFQGSRECANFRLSQLLPQSGYDRWGISAQILPIESDMTQTSFQIQSDVNLPPALATLTYDVLVTLNLLWA